MANPASFWRKSWGTKRKKVFKNIITKQNSKIKWTNNSKVGPPVLTNKCNSEESDIEDKEDSDYEVGGDAVLMFKSTSDFEWKRSHWRS